MHDEALTKETAQLLPRCSRFKGFYLVGGTALAMQIGHRISVDLDFFSEHALPTNLLTIIKHVFPGSSISVTYRTSEQLDLIINSVKVTFFYFPYPLVTPLKKIQYVSLASIHEIAAMKAFSIGKRLAYKDYVDWYFLLKERHVSLQKTISYAGKKFGGDFSDRLFLGQLVSLQDVPTQKISFLRNPVGRETVEKFLKKTVRAFSLR